MRFAPRRSRQMPESVVPMINVVFLLLIFFMMSATITPAPPFDLTLPQSQDAGDLEGEDTLYISQDGVVAFGGALDEAAWAALVSADQSNTLTLRADAALPATSLAQVLARLAAMDRADIELVIRKP